MVVAGVALSAGDAVADGLVAVGAGAVAVAGAAEGAAAGAAGTVMAGGLSWASAGADQARARARRPHDKMRVRIIGS